MPGGVPWITCRLTGAQIRPPLELSGVKLGCEMWERTADPWLNLTSRVSLPLSVRLFHGLLKRAREWLVDPTRVAKSR